MKIAEKLRQLESRGEKALAAFSTVGDPDRKTSVEIFAAMGNSGADILELGIPYSDPLMDGPVLQRAYLRSLNRGFSLADLPRFVEDVKARTDTPMLIMSCCNPMYRYGVRRFLRDVSSAGVDSVLITDLPPEEWGESHELAKQFELGTIFLVAPTTPVGRMEKISSYSSPFTYCISKLGVTGTSESVPRELKEYVKFVKEMMSGPVLVGFGVSDADQARLIGGLADGVIVGSAFSAIIERHLDDTGRMLSLLEKFTSDLKNALKK